MEEKEEGENGEHGAFPLYSGMKRAFRIFPAENCGDMDGCFSAVRIMPWNVW